MSKTRTAVVLSLCFALASSALAQGPVSPAPRLGVLSKDAKGNLTLQDVVEEEVPRTIRERHRNSSGRVVFTERTVYETVNRSVTIELSAEATHFYIKGRGDVSYLAMLREVSGSTPALIATGPIDDQWLAGLARGSIVIFRDTFPAALSVSNHPDEAHYNGTYLRTDRTLNGWPVYSKENRAEQADSPFRFNYLFRLATRRAADGYLWVLQPVKPHPTKYQPNSSGEGATPWQADWNPRQLKVAIALGPAPPAPDDPDKSVHIDDSTVRVSFTNHTGDDVGVYWVDFDGKETDYGLLKDDDSFEQQTGPGHLWVFKSGGTSMGRYRATTAARQQYTVTGRRTARPPRRPIGPVVNRFDPTIRRHLHSISTGRSELTVAYIGPLGHIHFHTGSKEAWQHRETRPDTKLVPWAPLFIEHHDRAILPYVYTINAAGEIVEITGGIESRALSSPAFPQGGHLELFSEGRDEYVVAVNKDGIMWQAGVNNRFHRMIAPTKYQYPAGAPVAVFNLANRVEVYTVDQRGTMTRHARLHGLSPTGEARNWAGPITVAAGFEPGTYLDAELATDPRNPDNALQLIAAVDRQGFAQVIKREDGRQSERRIGRAVPGAPISIDIPEDASETMVTSVISNGQWMDTVYGSKRAMESSPIHDGFPAGGAIEMTGYDGPGFAFDAKGHLVEVYFDKVHYHWDVYPVEAPVSRAGVARRPRLVASEFVPNKPLAPVDVFFTNTHTEELVIKLVDRTNPRSSISKAIPRRDSISLKLNRDAGGQLVEVWEYPIGIDEWNREEKSVTVPPKVLYDVAVYENKETYKVIGRFRQRGFSLNSLVSVGAFEVAAGDEVRDNARIDTYRDAKRNRNPGAVSRFGKID